MKFSMLKSTAKIILGTAKTMSKDPTRYHLQLISVEKLEEKDHWQYIVGQYAPAELKTIRNIILKGK